MSSDRLTPHEAVREGLREVKAGETVKKAAEAVIARREAETNGKK